MESILQYCLISHIGLGFNKSAVTYLPDQGLMLRGFGETKSVNVNKEVVSRKIDLLVLTM
jgi:hypothetical protein